MRYREVYKVGNCKLEILEELNIYVSEDPEFIHKELIKDSKVGSTYATDLLLKIKESGGLIKKTLK